VKPAVVIFLVVFALAFVALGVPVLLVTLG
jgi:hypothetical protein